MMGESQNNQQSACNEVECDGSAFILITCWVTNRDDEYSQKIKVIADILRRKFDEGLLNTLLSRNMYRGTLTFADFCYLSGDMCFVDEIGDGRYKVIMPSCLYDVMRDSYARLVLHLYTDDGRTEPTLFSLETGVSNENRVRCEFLKSEAKNIEGKEPPTIQSQHQEDIDALYLREIANHGKRHKTG